MSSHAERRLARDAGARPRSGWAWFVLAAGLFAAVWALALLSPGTLDALWSDLRGLPPVAEVLAWLVALPWVLSIAVWHTGWPDAVRFGLMAAFTVGWSLAFAPRRGSR